MAAGEGRRLRPLTKHWPKPALPIDGRPVISTVLRQLREAGCGEVTVVTGHLAERLEALVGDGSAFGLTLRFARQAEPIGSADAVSRALAAGAEPPLLAAAADTVFGVGDMARFAAAFAASGAPGAVAVRRDPPPGPDRAAVDVAHGRVTRIGGTARGPLAHASLWGLGARLLPYLQGLDGPPYELAAAYQGALDDGLEVSAYEVGRTRDLTDPLDLVEENFPYLKGI
jgi:NDP-sugar pyrophosphorylase family protein